ncbi:efflux RND transporter periplasmic adaptor subunit [Xylophilus sp. Kf1]|nr:efflux RND transporter periplasmic adaptor subunit [Xylophilus sp. Kf1]
MTIRPLLLAAIAGMASAVLTGCGDKPPASPSETSAPLVRTALVVPAGESTRTFTGIVAARVESELGFRVAGKVSERLVDAGQTVRKGQALMRIDPVDLRLAASAQQENVGAASARARQTADDEARMRDLVATGAVSASAYDQARAAAAAAKAQLGAAEAQAAVARNTSGYAVLNADADGVVVDTLAEPGQVVAAGQAVIRIANAGRREAVVQLPETLRPAPGSTAMASLYGRDAAATPARIRQLSNAADRVTRTFEARYVLEGALADAPLGTTVTLRIARAANAGAAGFQVPMGALLDTGQGAGVWLVDGSPLRVVWRPVEVRALGDDSATVGGALKAGDKVVALGAHLLKDAQPVRLIGDASQDGARK